MINEILIEIIEDYDKLENTQIELLMKMWKLSTSWKNVVEVVNEMNISERNRIKILDKLSNIGDELIEICNIMKKENYK